MKFFRYTVAFLTILAMPLSAAQHELTGGYLSGVVDREPLVVYTLPAPNLLAPGDWIAYIVEFEDWTFKTYVRDVVLRGSLEYCNVLDFHGYSEEADLAGSSPRYVVRDGHECLELTLYDFCNDDDLVDGEYRYCVLQIPLFRNPSGKWLGRHQYMLVR